MLSTTLPKAERMAILKYMLEFLRLNLFLGVSLIFILFTGTPGLIVDESGNAV